MPLRPYLIAELSANHNNDLGRALKIIDAAKWAGADAIKFQTYTADTMTLNCDKVDFIVPDGLWKGRSLYDLYSEGSLRWDWHEKLITHAKSVGLDVISTPFDPTAVEFLETLAVDAYKIASFELVDTQLIKKVAETKKHTYVSTGMASISEIREAIRKIGHNEITLFHCISSYPAKAADSNLPFMVRLKEEFQLKVGLSDHCITNYVAGAAIALGATVIEKHFTLERSSGGLDDSFSQTPDTFKQLRQIVDEIYDAVKKHDTRTDILSKRYRKSIYACADIKMGEKFNPDNIRIIRPGFGLEPKYYEMLVGSEAKSDYKFGDRILDVELL